MSKSKPYRAKSLKGAVAMVRQHRRQIATLTALLDRFDAERKMLAKLAAETPQFDNPLHVLEAKQIRDSILKR